MRVRFRTEAAADVSEAKGWYDAQRPGLGDAFVESLKRVVDLMSALPEAFPEIAVGLRRALLPRFPMALSYRVDDDMACLHTRRSPDRWRSRG